MCATAAAAGAFVVAAAVALCALPCILAVAEDDRVSNEVQGLDGKHNKLGQKSGFLMSMLMSIFSNSSFLNKQGRNA